MANDRIYVRHKASGEQVLLFKYYPHQNGYLAEGAALEGFLNRHLVECGQDLGGDPRFDLVTESESPPEAKGGRKMDDDNTAVKASTPPIDGDATVLRDAKWPAYRIDVVIPTRMPEVIEAPDGTRLRFQRLEGQHSITDGKYVSVWGFVEIAD